jgi:hypothetical protein
MKILLILFYFSLFFVHQTFAQHSLQLDFGGGYSTIQASNPGGIYILPPGGGTLLTNSAGNPSWLITGNMLSGGTPSTPNEVLGSANAYDVLLVTGGTEQMRLLNSGGVNIPLSTSAGIGVIFQNNAPYIHSIGSGQCFFAGPNAGNLSVTGTANTGIGDHALNTLTNTNNNTAVGANSLSNITTGERNTGVGANALDATTTGVQNTACGYFALANNIAGNDNTSTGDATLSINSTGSENTADGFDALRNNTSGNQNTASGDRALISNNTGSNNTGLGYLANVGANNLDNAAAIGANATVCASNTMVFGDGNVVGWGFGVCPGGSAIKVGTNNTNGNGASLSLAGVWTNASSRTFKDRFRLLSGSEILTKIRSLEILGWYYKGTNEYHIGPIAEDFYTQFGTGDQNDKEYSAKHISSIDPAGVALIGVKELQKENDILKAKLHFLEERIEKLESSSPDKK